MLCTHMLYANISVNDSKLKRKHFARANLLRKKLARAFKSHAKVL